MISALRRVRRTLVETYATLDERSLGLGRVVLALTLLIDLGKRVPTISTWYSNEGLLPNHTMLWSPPYDHTFSLFFMASHWYEAALGFVLCAASYLFLLVGYKTKLAQLASFVAVLSLHGRVMFLQIGGDVAMSELSFWTLFLPLGRRFSVDSLLETLRRLERGEKEPERPRGVVSFACFALLFQLAIVYVFNAWQKNGPMWKDGSLLHYVLALDPIVTRYGFWLREVLTPGLSALLTHSTRVAEALIPVALFLPFAVRYARTFAVLTIVGLHVGFAALLNVGLFSLAMIAYTPTLLPAAFWDSWVRRGSGRRKQRTPRRDPALVFAERVRNIADEPDDLLHELGKMPFGKWLAEIAELPYGKQLLLGLARAAVRRARRDAKLELDKPPARPLPAWLRRLPAVAVALALYVSVAQAGQENPVVPKALQAPLPAWGSHLVHYLQLYQGWHMFAPEAMRGDIALSVDAVTKDGRHVDPFNEFARPGRPAFADRIPPQLGYNVFVNSYFGRIADTPAYHGAFVEWLLRYHERTGRPEDQIVSFRASLLLDESPPLGEREPKNPRSQVFLEHPSGK